MTDSMKFLVRVALNDSTLCKQFIKRASVLNITSLTSSSGLAASNDFCKQTPVFKVVSTVLIPSTAQPSSQPSSRPSNLPLNSGKNGNKPRVVKVVLSDTCMGFLALIILIFFLRVLHPLYIEHYPIKEGEKTHYLYDIMVLLDDNEVAVFENIRHKDIIFSRRTKVVNEGQTLDWVMNLSRDLLEKQFEVQFYDRFNLLVQSRLTKTIKERREGRDNEVHKDKVGRSNNNTNNGELQIGMILNVKFRQAEDTGSEYLSSLNDPEMCGCISSGLKMKPLRLDRTSMVSHHRRHKSESDSSLLGGSSVSRGRRDSKISGINPMLGEMFYDSGRSDSDGDKKKDKEGDERRRQLSCGGKNFRERHRLQTLVHSDSYSSADDVSIDLRAFMSRASAASVSRLHIPGSMRWPIRRNHKRKSIEDKIREEILEEEVPVEVYDRDTLNQCLSRSSHENTHHSPLGFASSLSSLSLNSEEYAAMFRSDVTFNKPWLLGRYAASRGSLSVSDESADVEEDRRNSLGDPSLSSSSKWRIILDSPFRRSLVNSNFDIQEEMEMEIEEESKEGKEEVGMNKSNEEKNDTVDEYNNHRDMYKNKDKNKFKEENLLDISEEMINTNKTKDDGDGGSSKENKKQSCLVRSKIDNINKICSERDEIDKRNRNCSMKNDIGNKSTCKNVNTKMNIKMSINQNRIKDICDICIIETKETESQWHNSVLRKLFLSEDFNEEKAD